MRILVVAPFTPSLEGVHGGARSIAQRLTRTAERHEVCLLHFRQQSEPGLDARLAARMESEDVVLLPWHARGRMGRALEAGLGLLAGRPLWVTELASAEFRRRLAGAVERLRPDVVQFEYAVMAQYGNAFRDRTASRMLVDHDPDREASMLQDPHRRLLRHVDRAAWSRFERDMLARVDAVVVFTERDKRLLAARRTGARIVTIPLGTDAVEAEAVPAGDKTDVLFVGNFVHPPNVDAAARLVRGIFPQVRDRVPAATLTIVGPEPPGFDSAPGLTVTGRVESVRPYYERAAAFAVPLRFGGGMRVKVLEALALGVPVVATSLALEGLDVADGEHVLVAESEAEFRERLVELLVDGALRASLGARGAAWARANLGWDAIADAYDALYAELMRERP